jgi:hypothetical protein
VGLDAVQLEPRTVRCKHDLVKRAALYVNSDMKFSRENFGRHSERKKIHRTEVNK